MLILTRKPWQRIAIDSPTGTRLWVTATDCGAMFGDVDASERHVTIGDVTVNVLRSRTKHCRKGQITIGITAPRSHIVRREELIKSTGDSPCQNQ